MADSFSDEEIDAAIGATFRPEVQAPEAQEPTTVGLPQMPDADSFSSADIDAAINDEFGSLDQRVKASMYASEKVDPDRRAEAIKLSKQFNLPPAIIERNYDSFKVKASKPDLDDLHYGSPGLARFLSKPENAALAKDDVDSLRKIEKGYARLKPKQEGAIASATAAGWGQLKMSANSLAVAYGYMSPEDAAEANADIMKTLNEIESTKPDFAKEAETVLNKESKDISAGMDEVFDAMESWRRGKIKESLVGGAVGTAKTIGEFFDLVGTAATMPKGTGYLILQNAVSSSPGLISGAAGGLYGFGMGGPGGAAVGFLGAGFAGEYAVEVGAWTSNEVSKRVKDNTDPEQLKAIYQDANLMAEIRKQAERKGLGTAGVSMLFNLAGGRLLKRATTLPGKAAAGAGELAIQATGEGVSEATGQIYANEGDFTKVDWNEVGLETVLGLGHQVGELAMSPVRMGAQAAADAARSRVSEERVAEIRSELNADPVRAVEDLSERVQTVDDSLKKAQVIDEVIEVAANSKLGKRLDGKIKELISEIAATDETATVYFQPDDFDNFWTKKGLSPVKAASELLGDNGKAYNEAKETGQPIAVPIEQYVEVVSKDQETAHELTNILRADPAGPSVIEARELNRALPQIFNKLKEEASSQSAVISDAEQEATQIADELAEQAKAAGRPARETKWVKEVHKSWLLKTAQESGMTPRQLHDKYGLRISNPAMAAAMPVETVPLTAGESVLEQEGFSLFQQGRGRIRFGSDRKFTIELLKNADPSTLLHELGHFYLEVMGDLAQAEGASSQIKDDFNTLLEWFGVSDRSQITTEHHEQLARGFEAYLMEGKAPANAPKGLVKAFYNFKQWLINKYKTMKALRVELNDDVRRVFDRLLVSDQATTEAAADMMSDPLLSDAELAGLSDAQAARYLEMREEARIAAENEVRSKVFKDFELSTAKAYKQRAAGFKVEFENQANAMPVFNVIEGLRHNKRADGTPLTDMPVKLNLDEIKQVYGEAVASKLPKGLTGKAGLPAEMIAPLFGYESAKQMIDELISTPSKKQWVEDRVKAATEATAPDAGWQLNVVNDAIEAYHNEHRERIMRMEMEFMAQNDFPQFKDMAARLIKRLPRMERAKAEAARIIGQGKVRHVKPDQYVRAQGKYAGVAAKAFKRGDLQAAWDAKYKELLNFYLYREARTQEKQIAKDLEFFKKLKKADKDLAKSRDTDIVNAARAVLSMYGLDRQGKPAVEHLEKIQKYDPETYAYIAAMVNGASSDAGPYKDVSVEKFNEMSESVRALWDLSKTSQEVQVGNEKIEIDKAVDELVKQMEPFFKKKLSKAAKKKMAAGTELSSTATAKDIRWFEFANIRGIFRRYEGWIDVKDLGDINGAFRKFLYKGVSDSLDVMSLTNKSFQKRYIDLAKPIAESIDYKKPIEAAEIGFKFQNKAELLGAILHTGNESNKRKLLLGREWAAKNEDGSLDTRNWDKFINRMASEGVLTKADMDFIQSLWDLMSEIWPMAQRAHKSMFGFYAKELDITPIQTPWGEYKGGYAPAAPDRYDIRNQDTTNKKDAQEFVENSPMVLMPHSGGGGFTKSRVEFNKPLSLDLGLVPRHIESALRFSIVKPAVKDAVKVAFNSKFSESLRQIDSSALEKIIVPALTRADKGTAEIAGAAGSKWLSNMAKVIQSRTAMQFMFFNLPNTIEQGAGYAVAAQNVSPKRMAKALRHYAANPKESRKTVDAMSTFMRARGDSQIFEMSKTVRNIFSEKTFAGDVQEFSQKHVYFTQSFTQNIMETHIWMAAYDQGLADGLTVEKSIEFADSVIRTSQGSLRGFDKSTIEDQKWLQFVQMFYGFFNMLGNKNASELAKLYYQEMGLKKKVARGFYLYLMGYASVAVVSAAVRKAASGSLDEDDDDEYVDDLMDVFVWSQLDLGLAMIPVMGGMTTSAIKELTGRTPYARPSVSPAMSVVMSVGKGVGAAASVFDDDDLKKSEVRDALTAMGIITGTPMGALSRPIGYLMDIDSGKARPTGPIDFTRGILTGKPGAR